MEEETHARPYKYVVVNLIDLKVLNVKGSAYSLNILLLKHLRPSFVRIAVISK